MQSILIFLAFLAPIAGETTRVSEPAEKTPLKAVEHTVKLRHSEWVLERKLDTPTASERSWIAKPREIGQENVSRLTARFFLTKSSEDAKQRLVHARMNTSLSPVQGDLPNGDGCIVWKGYVNPNERLFQCTVGSVFYVMVAPSEEIGRQFAADISEGLKAAPERM